MGKLPRRAPLVTRKNRKDEDDILPGEKLGTPEVTVPVVKAKKVVDIPETKTAEDFDDMTGFISHMTVQLEAALDRMKDSQFFSRAEMTLIVSENVSLHKLLVNICWA